MIQALRRIARIAGPALLMLVVASSATAQKRLTKKELRKLPVNHPAQCPHTGGDPELLAQMGILSTAGGFEFGDSDTAATEELLPGATILWAETEHFKIGFALGSYKIPGGEKRKIQAELQELTPILPDLSTRIRVLDPWLRLYLIARRMERVWDRFLEVMRVEESAFPAAGETFILGNDYWGQGPFVGMKEKFEILVLSSEAQLTDFLSDHFGLQMKYTQRWHQIERGALIVVCHERQASLRVDEALHTHLAYNVAANLLDGFKHYAYDLPVWIKIGFAHALEREVSPHHNSFEGAEGSSPQESREDDWEGEVRKLLAKGEAPRMSELVSKLTFGDLELKDHFVSWSMTRYLIDEHPEAYATFLGKLKGLVNEEGYADGSGMSDHHRRLMRECFDMTYAQFDVAWSRWAQGIVEEEEEGAEGTE